MDQRLLAATILAITLLFNQGGSFLIAALCPHLKSGATHCDTPQAQTTMSHDDMGHMDMQHAPEPEPNPYAAAVSHLDETCSHCAMHSRTSPNAFSLITTEAVKRSTELDVPFVVTENTKLNVFPVATLLSRAHSPPGESTPRHVLINIFRI